MPLDYTNTDIIFSTNGTVFGDLFSQNDRGLISSRIIELSVDDIDDKIIEFHIYDTRGNLLLSNHNVSMDTWRTSLQAPINTDHFPPMLSMRSISAAAVVCPM